MLCDMSCNHSHIPLYHLRNKGNRKEKKKKILVFINNYQSLSFIIIDIYIDLIYHYYHY